VLICAVRATAGELQPSEPLLAWFTIIPAAGEITGPRAEFTRKPATGRRVVPEHGSRPRQGDDILERQGWADRETRGDGWDADGGLTG
jgi:hypothetical protein